MSTAVIVAHRGLSALYPENTLIAIERAIHHGARAVEFDVQLTADQVPVLFHDASLLRMTGLAGNIMEIYRDQLENYPASFPERFGTRFKSNQITALEEVIDLCHKNPRVIPCIEIKEESLACFGLDTCINAILKVSEPVSSCALYLSFSRPAVELLHANGIRTTGWVLEAYDDEHRAAAEKLKPQVLICDIRKLPGNGTVFWPGDYEWMVYQTEDPEVVKKFAEQGVAYIETDNVKAVAESLPELFQ